MKKKSPASSAHGARAARNGRTTRRRRIDFSDIPELSAEQLGAMRRLGRPPRGEQPRKLISIRLDHKVLAWVKALAARKDRPYQTLISEILEAEMTRGG